MFHKFYRDPLGEWVSLEDLRAGDRLRGADGVLTVVSVSPENRVDRVYNMTVEGEHVYFVSPLGLLAHNNRCSAKKAKSRLPKAVTEELPQGVGRTPAQNEQARNYYKRNIEEGRNRYEKRTGEQWPTDPKRGSLNGLNTQGR